MTRHRLPIVGLVALASLAGLSGCFTPSHGIVGYDVSAERLESPPPWSIAWEETDPQARPPEILGLFDDADDAYAANRSALLLVSKERQEGLLAFCEAEWARQTGQPSPEGGGRPLGSYPFSKGGRHYLLGFGYAVA